MLGEIDAPIFSYALAKVRGIPLLFKGGDVGDGYTASGRESGVALHEIKISLKSDKM